MPLGRGGAAHGVERRLGPGCGWILHPWPSRFSRREMLHSHGVAADTVSLCAARRSEAGRVRVLRAWGRMAGGWRCVAFGRPVLAAEPVTVVPRLPGGSPHSSRLPSAWCIGGDLPDSEGGAARRAGAPHSRWSDEDHLISERMFREYRFVWAYVLHACMLYTASVNPQGGHRFRKSSFRLIVEHVTRW